MSAPPAQNKSQRRPWPMTWVAGAIAAYIIIYTAINFGFRKAAPAHEPWQEAQDRRNQFVSESMMAWTRFRMDARNVDGAGALAPAVVSPTVRSTPAQLEEVVPKDLAIIMPGRPELRAAPAALQAPSETPAATGYRFRLAFPADDRRTGFGEILAYAKEHHLRIFLQTEEKVPAGQDPFPATAWVELSLPPGALEPGAWQATFYTADSMFDWRFEIR